MIFLNLNGLEPEYSHQRTEKGLKLRLLMVTREGAMYSIPILKIHVNAPAVLLYTRASSINELKVFEAILFKKRLLLKLSHNFNVITSLISVCT